MRLAFDDLVGWACLKTTGHRRTPQDTTGHTTGNRRTPQDTAGHTTGHHRTLQDTPQETAGHTTGHRRTHHRTPQDTPQVNFPLLYAVVRADRRIRALPQNVSRASANDNALFGHVEN